MAEMRDALRQVMGMEVTDEVLQSFFAQQVQALKQVAQTQSDGALAQEMSDAVPKQKGVDEEDSAHHSAATAEEANTMPITLSSEEQEQLFAQAEKEQVMLDKRKWQERQEVRIAMLRSLVTFNPYFVFADGKPKPLAPSFQDFYTSHGKQTLVTHTTSCTPHTLPR